MTRLVGIARLAAESPSLEAKRETEYFELPTRKYLARCDSPRMPFRWMINPYRGCEFGCKYCYARYTHEFMELHDSEAFERKIFVKHFDGAAFRSEMRRLPTGEAIAIGTATDPYQPAERRYRLTRSILESLAQNSGYRIGLITKSDLITRDIDIFQEINRRNYLTLVVTITTLDRDLARLLEPLAPRPDLRLNAVRKLSAAGLRVAVNLAPILPLINDAEPSLDAVAKASARAGAAHLGGNVVYLKPCAQKVFFPFLEQHFPAYVRRYRERFECSAYIRGAYPDMIRERIDRIRSRYNLRPREEAREQPELWPEDPQMTLFSGVSDEGYMRIALDLAREAEAYGEVPVGAVIVIAGEVIGRGRNSPIARCDPTAHAEILALREACAALGNYRLEGACLYTTLEPCVMCAGALVAARIAKVVFGTRDLRFGGVRSKFRLADSEVLNHRLTIEEGVLGAECAELMLKFFAERRG